MRPARKLPTRLRDYSAGAFTFVQEAKQELCRSIALRSRRTAHPDERHPPSANPLLRPSVRIWKLRVNDLVSKFR